MKSILFTEFPIKAVLTNYKYSTILWFRVLHDYIIPIIDGVGEPRLVVVPRNMHIYNYTHQQ